jgi:hypothetical protein
VGSVGLGQYAFNLAVDGTRAVVHFGNSEAYLGVIDVSAPAAPVVLGSVAVDAAGGILALALSGGRAYVADGPNGLKIYDISQPSLLTEMGETRDGFTSTHIAAKRSISVVTGTDVATNTARLVVVDTSDPTVPTVIGTLPNAASAILDVALNDAGTVAAVALGTGGIWVIDLGNPAAPVKRGVYDTAGVAMAVALSSSGTVAYVADGVGGVKVVSLANPAAPTLIGSLAISGGIQRDIVVAGTLAYVLDQTGRLLTVDVTTPSAPRQVGSVGLGQYAFNLAVDGTRAVVHFGNSAAYLGVIDVSAPAAPVLLGSAAVDAAGGILGLAAASGRAYVADGAQGLKIYDISQASGPTLFGGGYTVGDAMDVAFDGTRVQAADATSTVSIIDLYGTP